ncbi:chromosome segregation protein SMC [Thioflavicoccus mobilis 8321]|uniref:Chromosome partition protein Smc n=1 Tax=Thioflavicoccus mobilis 8321 TaxID=765912 RepID=L0GWJ9_9GAMM|nr:chromosome segregation protein SMC [Thioflavicoccus mobilis]AGA89745.1 chromosome segregation protein SMC [Thioflavicoccus mobilis 8321]
MRLEKIKLAGFKSFVDPTSVPFLSDLVGVVGPNGCGKSNVIDAVRWVMGESSAKMLRGESMADVIFNGSSSRKPVGMASIELLFDNGDGGVGGEYARFSQIAVKRQVSRDGQSVYFLNGARCRRRDVQDLFLGTGLGPRSYAIIEQGTISRLIEARPEELRLFLEEAAGISKYKERRRETETRMRHTRENLDRLNDLRDEVAKQLQHLERQAASAARYQQLKVEERQREAELKALRWRTLDREVGEQDRTLGGLEVRLSESQAHQRRIEADLETQRDAYADASEAFNEAQGRYYEVGGAIARIEQAIQFMKETRTGQEGELARVRRELDDSIDHLARDEARLAELAAALADEEPALARVEAELGEVIERVAASETALHEWDNQWEALEREAAVPGEQAQAERARINHLEQGLGQDERRLARLAEEARHLDPQPLEDEVEGLLERDEECEVRVTELEAARQALEGEFAELERQGEAVQRRLDEVRTGLQEARGRHASLVALQEAARQDPDAGLAGWLEAAGLAAAPRLLDHLEVEPGWERAVEVALAAHLRAVCTDEFEAHGRAGGEVGALALLDTRQAAAPAVPDDDGLSARVRCPWSLHGLLGSVGAVEDLETALARRGELGPGERLITRDGVLVGANWLHRPTLDGVVGGVLERAEALKDVEREIAAAEAALAKLVGEQEAAQAVRRERLAQREQVVADLEDANRERGRLRAELVGRRTRLEHLHERRAAIEAERGELGERRGELIAEIEVGREQLHDLLARIEQLAERRERLAAQRDALREALATARAAERSGRDQVQQRKVGVESQRTEQEALRRNLSRARSLRDQHATRLEELTRALAEAAEPFAERQAELEEQLGQQVEAETALRVARDHLEEIDTRIRELEQERQRIEQAVAEHARNLDALRLARQERLVRRRTLEEQLASAEQNAEALLAGLDPAASEEVWQEELTKIAARIQRLGAVNLAAIDELKEQSERRVYLDAQHADITRSLETLEQAIRKIDRETRQRFKDTFERVNEGFASLFPRLFGGGQAYLDLTGEDLLETGVTVMARPPGKRNSSIHLLSGGEKALTAVALVFAIFQLNPAPFCMLDEVDAPLDEANVGRFCDLLRSMSSQVQFIFITHNKVTMEVAQHLLGVTMHEPGVSRLVSVDVDAAVELAAAS